MFFDKLFTSNRLATLSLAVISSTLLMACGSGDLNPSDNDLRPTVEKGITGGLVGQTAANFEATNSLGETIELDALLEEFDAVVLYFTMWCPVCDTHMTHMRRYIIDEYQEVEFIAVDFVSGSVDYARDSQLSSGYGGSDFEVIVDIDQSLEEQFQGAMGITLLIDNQGQIVLNEDYKNGKPLQTALDDLYEEMTE